MSMHSVLESIKQQFAKKDRIIKALIDKIGCDGCDIQCKAFVSSEECIRLITEAIVKIKE